MKKILFSIAIVLVLVFLSAPTSSTRAQMMGGLNKEEGISSDEIAKTKQEEQEGKNVYDLLKSGKETCQSLGDEDFEKLGEYFMGQMAGSPENHVYMDKMMQSRMNADDKSYHIAMGRNQSGCSIDDKNDLNKGGAFSMMGGYGFGNMMGGYGYNSYFGVFSFLIGFTFWIVLVLLAIYLYQKIKNPKK